MLTKIHHEKRWQALLVSSVMISTSFWGLEAVRANNSRENADRGWPTRRVGGGSRTPCPVDQPCQPLMAVVSNDLMRTVSYQPTLLFYLPRIENSREVRIEFVLRDGNDRLVYEKTFTSNGQEGIIEVTIATTEKFKGLEVNQHYHWYLSIIYNPKDRSKDNLVEGWIQRVPLSAPISRQLEQLNPIEQVKLYQSENIWTEALSTLVDLKRSRPRDEQVSLLWTQMLSSLNLPNLSRESLSDRPSPISRSSLFL